MASVPGALSGALWCVKHMKCKLGVLCMSPIQEGMDMAGTPRLVLQGHT
jgi:hypothetical protein